MKKVFVLVVLVISVVGLGYRVTTVSWYDNGLEDYRYRLECLTGEKATETVYTVIVADSTGEFCRLSGLPYWVLAGVRDDTIFMQPLSLNYDPIRSIAHELSHIAFRKYGFPYWVEEGLVCIVTCEWMGANIKELADIETVEPSKLDFYSYQKYSFTAWKRVSLLLQEHTFEELVKLFPGSDGGRF